MLVLESIKATSVKENFLLITKVISVCYFCKMTLSIKLKEFYLLLSILSLFETLISVASSSIGGSGGFVSIMSITGESINGLGMKVQLVYKTP